MARWSPKLPTASVTNAWSLDDLTDPPGFWLAVEAATAHHLGSAGAWVPEAVAAAIESYVRDAEDEAAAVPVGDARAHVADLRRAAAAFAQALHPQRTSAVAQAETLIEEMADHDAAVSFRILLDSAHAFVAACDRALARLGALAKSRHFAPGEAWERFIAALADAFEAAIGRPATAAKDRDAARVSPFVQFAHAIQVLLPRQFWRHPAATARSPAASEPGVAFAQAVARALAARRTGRKLRQQPEKTRAGRKPRARTKNKSLAKAQASRS